MDESPNLLSTQRLEIGWDMESPNTTKVTPRSVFLPNPKSLTDNKSPRFLIEQWGSGKKRKLKRPPKPNLYKRPGLLEAEMSEFDDGMDDELLSQITLTPMKCMTPGKSETATPGEEVTPGEEEPGQLAGHSADRSKEHLFKTPTTFKHYSHNTDTQKVLPRKLTAEFDNVNSRQDPQQRKPMSNISNPLNSAVLTSKNLCQQQQIIQVVSKPVNLENSFDEFFGDSSDDEELIRQADMYAATQPGPLNKPSTVYTNIQAVNQQTIANDKTESSKSTLSLNNSSNNFVQHKNKSEINNNLRSENSVNTVPQSYDSDVDFFLDDDDDDDLLMEITSGLTETTPTRQSETPERKKQRLSLSLKKNRH